MIKVGKNLVKKSKTVSDEYLFKYQGQWYNLPNVYGNISGKDLIEAVFEAGIQKCKTDLKEILGVKG